MEKGTHVAITGIVDGYTRKAAFERIRACGGIPQDRVTLDTDYLIIGRYRRNTPPHGISRKMVLAEHYRSEGRNIKLIDAQWFEELLKA